MATLTSGSGSRLGGGEGRGGQSRTHWRGQSGGGRGDLLSRGPLADRIQGALDEAIAQPEVRGGGYRICQMDVWINASALGGLELGLGTWKPHTSSKPSNRFPSPNIWHEVKLAERPEDVRHVLGLEHDQLLVQTTVVPAKENVGRGGCEYRW